MKEIRVSKLDDNSGLSPAMRENIFALNKDEVSDIFTLRENTAGVAVLQGVEPGRLDDAARKRGKDVLASQYANELLTQYLFWLEGQHKVHINEDAMRSIESRL